MRLTLRTLLAYLDDLLDPADAVELGKRIEENKFASELVNRIRTRMRLLRLAAPKVDGRGMGADANTVAEYLDNTLPPDLVPDFEKICLESDVHLAEVASCHQILAAVQDHPAPFDPELKERVFNVLTAHGERSSVGTPDGLAHDLGATDSELTATSGLSTAGASVAPASATKSAGQDQKSTGMLPLLATVAAMFLVALLGLRALGPFDRTHPVARWVGLGAAPNPVDVASNVPASSDGHSDRSPLEAADSDRPADARQDASGADGKAGVGVQGVGEDARGAGPNDAGTNGDRPATASPPAEGETQPGTPAGREPDEPRPAVGGGGEGPLRPIDAGAGPNAPPLAGVDPFDQRIPERVRPGPDGGLAPAKAGSRPGVAPPEPPSGPESAPTASEVGRFLSENHVLARRAPQDGLWHALARGARLEAGDQLVSLPIYRPQFVLASGVQVMMVGEGAIGLRSMDATDSDAVQLVVASGRLLTASSGKVDSVLPLNLAGLAGVVRFLDVDAELAIEVRRYLTPGSDPATDEPLTVTQLSARAGRIIWTPAEGADETIPSGHVRVEVAGQPARIERAGYPAWADPKSVSKLDRDASEHLADQISPTRPLMLSLDEQLEFRRTEVRSLAARCLAQLGQYAALVRELNSEQQHSYWDEAVDGLRAGLTRSPEEAGAIQAALGELGKEDSERAYRLLRDFSPEQLEQGGAAQMVDYLDHPDLAIRVLSYENLRRITGSTQFYRPEAPTDRRKATVQSWRKRLSDGLIVYKTPPSPVPDREPTPKAEPEPPTRSPLP